MSFSMNVKNEVCRLDSSREELISELSGIVRNSAVIDKSIVITVENNSVARRIFKLFKNIYDITPIITVRKKYFNNGLSYILNIRGKIDLILYDLSIINKVISDYEFDSNEEIAKKEYEKLYRKYSRKYSGRELEYKIKEKLYQKGLKYEKD